MNQSKQSGTIEAPGANAISRRSLISWGTGVASLLAAAGEAGAQVQAARPEKLTRDLLAKLVRRTSMGVIETEMNLARSMGYEAFLEYQLNHAAIDDSQCDARLAALPTLASDLEPYEFFNFDPSQLIPELMLAVTLRAIHSKRQLFERMVEFWTDHFNVNMAQEYTWHLKTVHDRDAIRANALGTFPALLQANAQSAAMLHYLDNVLNVAGNPNENYARELMELHTMGVDGGYTQQDVIEVARCFTGWTEYGWSTGTNQGRFRYNPAVHDNGQKVVLGHIIPAGGGMQDGLTVLSILANHPSTARFIATKLCSRLLQEHPSQEAINAVASTYTATGGNIKAMVRTALQPKYLLAARDKYKRPFHVLVSALRTLPHNIENVSGIRWQLEGMGHEQYFWGTPDGYPDTFDHWSGLLLNRWNFGFSLVANEVWSLSIDHAAFFAGATTADQLVDRINSRMFAGELAFYDRQRIRQHVAPNPADSTRRRDAIGLAIASPSFQWY